MLKIAVICLIPLVSVMASPSSDSRKTVLASLDPTSIAQHMAFYDLYADTPEGKQALQHAWNLLSKQQDPDQKIIGLPIFNIDAIVALITREASAPPQGLSKEQLSAIKQLAANLKNRQLKGSHIWTEKELLALSPEEIDLGRAVLIHQFQENHDSIEQYEAYLDLMALQILARLPDQADPEEMIHAINYFIFQEMQFRFPPHSLHVKDIDLYTFLPSVLDSREGVCLGVSILYLTLAQRIGLPLEIITPPGHIYLRYRNGIKVVNIETTARGIDIPSDSYLGIDTRRLQQRNLKDVIGLSFVNHASVVWGRGDHEAAVKLYEKALPYMQDDPMLNMFLGFNYLFTGKKSAAKKLLQPLKNFTFDHAVSAETIPEDFFNGRVDANGIKAVFMHVDETRESILHKQATLQTVINRYPRFRAGLLQLAVTWLQLGRSSEAQEILEKYHQLDASNAVVEYYLSILCVKRYDYPKAWLHLHRAETLLIKREHRCKALRELRGALRPLYPAP